MTVDRERLRRRIQQERDLAERGIKRGREPKPPAQPPGHALSDLDRRLLDMLAAHQGPRGICPSVPRLAELLKVSVSSIQRSLRRLIAAELVVRVAVFERDDDPEWRRRGESGIAPRRQTRNTYRLTPGGQVGVEGDTGPGVTGFRETAAQTPVSRVERDTPRRMKEASTVSRGQPPRLFTPDEHEPARPPERFSR